MRSGTVFAAILWLSLGLEAASAQKRIELHFPDLPGYRTLKCDFHMHTVFSDGLVWPTVRVNEAWRDGLDVIALSDHIEYQPHKKDIPTNHNRPYELAVDAARRRDILLIRGAEVTHDTPPGHFNAVFLNDIEPLDTDDFNTQFEEADRQRAFVFWNHPGWKGAERGRWGAEQEELLRKKQLHGIEICNGGDHFAQAHQWALEKNLTLVGNSDIHGASLATEHSSPTEHRTLTLVFATERTKEGVRAALFAGRTVVWSKNRLFGKEEMLAAMFVASVEIAAPHHRSKDSVWVHIHNHSELDIELERIGDGRPANITLPARAVSLVRFRVSADDPPKGMPYRVLNLLVGPSQPLTVRLRIPGMSTTVEPENTIPAKAPVSS